eukprot:TRINITY_DN1091_c0_g1_i2.p1 TRINITY_DN1091_c0_g1~~TRINITY_DN1091_c0_g1_i2.p1  ORF type:complete len:708 (+),score=265.50 TRINITY_DN1091_c0_g1_i2:60-2126(+)
MKVAPPPKRKLPAYLKEREDTWNTLKAKFDSETQAKEHVPIKVTLPTGDVKEGLSFVTTPMDIANGIAPALAQNAVVAQVNGSLWDMTRPFEGDADLVIFKADAPEAKEVFRHSSAHAMGQCMELLFDGELCIGPALDEGFYYEMFMDENKVVESDYSTIESEFNKIIKAKQVFERIVVSREEAKDLFRHNKFKQRILAKLPENEVVTAYKCGPLIDLCRGPHIPTTKLIKAFKVTKNSASYWEAKADQESLQRIYGVAFADKNELKAWKIRMEEAAKRDHRLIGTNQELWYFHPLSPGSAFFLPHGARLYDKLTKYMQRQYWNRNYQEVITPNAFNKKLWETSGHWQKYKENMFTFEVEGQEYGFKPMNCPGHCLVFDQRVRSYKELPMRLAEFGVLHRNEISGALSGLTRVRRFVQDDGHIFARHDQIESEVAGVLDLICDVYKTFGFDFTLELSTRPECAIGDVEVWNKAEAQLESALNKFGKKWTLNPGDGAFYGPKIDIHVVDAMGRSFQCATCQLDFQLPERFDLKYQSPKADGSGDEFLRPVIVHRAIFGSLERFLAILTEHLSGKWPLWLSPRQVMVIPVTHEQDAYAEELRAKLYEEGFYAEADVSNAKFPKKVRTHQMAQWNVMLVVGQDESANRTVTIRLRDDPEKKRTIAFEDFVAEIKDECDLFKNWRDNVHVDL